MEAISEQNLIHVLRFQSASSDRHIDWTHKLDRWASSVCALVEYRSRKTLFNRSKGGYP